MADKNITVQAASDKPVEMGAVWAEPAPAGRKHSGTGFQSFMPAISMVGLKPPTVAAVASALRLPAWLLALPLRFKEGQP